MTCDKSERRESLSRTAFNRKKKSLLQKKIGNFNKDNEIVKDVAYVGSVVSLNGAKKPGEG